MSTPPPPARLRVLFAPEAPVAVIIRRGPTKWSQLILWNTDTDEFTPGQWLRGNVDYATLSPDGRYLAMGIMGGKSRMHSWEDTQYTLVSHPPFFTALAISFHGLCMTSICFLSSGHLNWFSSAYELRGRGKCPFLMTDDWLVHTIVENRPIGDGEQSTSGEDQSGRMMVVRDGIVYESVNGTERLLFDANQYTPTEIAPPDWALEW